MIIDGHLPSIEVNGDVEKVLSKYSMGKGYVVVILTEQDSDRQVPSNLACDADIIMSKNTILKSRV